MSRIWDALTFRGSHVAPARHPSEECPPADGERIAVSFSESRLAAIGEIPLDKLADLTDVACLNIPPLDPSVVRRALEFRSYDTDLPPEVHTWVGRDDQLSVLSATESRVIAITGIGGQGKSALAVKALERWRNAFPDGYWDWRDCREDGDRFPTQLASIITRLSHNAISAEALAAMPSITMSRIFFRLVRNSQGLVVFDNVDHYVDAAAYSLSGALHVFVQEALRARTRFKVVLTCRPRLQYPDTNYHEVRLLGLGERETILLMRARKIPQTTTSDDQIREISRLTGGHAFWLNILASELARKPNLAKQLIAELSTYRSESDQITAMLRPVWATLNAKERDIIFLLGECPKPLTESRLYTLGHTRVGTSNRFQRTLRAIVAFSLVSKKSSAGKESVYEVHPVVRQFLRTEFGLSQRKPFIRLIADGTKDYIVRVRNAHGVATLSIETFEFATVNIESHIQSGELADAAELAVSVSECPLGKPHLSIGPLRLTRCCSRSMP